MDTIELVTELVTSKLQAEEDLLRTRALLLAVVNRFANNGEMKLTKKEIESSAYLEGLQVNRLKTGDIVIKVLDKEQKS